MIKKGLISMNEYKGFRDCFKKVIKEEGIRGIYRGLSFHLMAIMIWMSMLPRVSEKLMTQVPFLYGGEDRTGRVD
jgi:hypothetical protein